MKKRAVRGLLIIAGLFVAALCFIGCATDDATQAMPAVTGIVAHDVVADYDGTAHYITVQNTLDGDTVYYSASAYGGWRESPMGYTMPGEYTVYYKVTRAGHIDFVSHACIRIRRTVLQNISAPDVTVIYDGTPQGIIVEGLEQGDVVEYSADGETFAEKCAVTEPGEYTVYYRVRRSYGDYADSCTLTVLPDISGRYVNAELGVITVTHTTAVVDGKEYALKYDVTACGTIGGKDFCVKDGVLGFDGAYYGKVDRARIYVLECNDMRFYVSGGERMELCVTFDGDGAEIAADGEKVVEISGVNYCENVSGEFTRGYDSSDIRATVKAEGSVTDVFVELSARPTWSAESINEYAVYDGSAHVFGADRAGEVLYRSGDGYTAELPRFTEVGIYTVEAVYLRDGYLPCKGIATFAVAADIRGVYFNGTGTVVIREHNAEINGVSYPCVFDNGWKINDLSAVRDGGALTVGDASYLAKRDAALLSVRVGETFSVAEHAERNITLKLEPVAAGVELSLSGASGNAVIENKLLGVGAVSLDVNGRRVLDSTVIESTYTYEIGTSELNVEPFARIEVYVE